VLRSDEIVLHLEPPTGAFTKLFRHSLLFNGVELPFAFSTDSFEASKLRLRPAKAPSANDPNLIKRVVSAAASGHAMSCLTLSRFAQVGELVGRSEAALLRRAARLGLAHAHVLHLVRSAHETF
jgi:hypothetical protein